jgi:hypothetical protein
VRAGAALARPRWAGLSWRPCRPPPCPLHLAPTHSAPPVLCNCLQVDYRWAGDANIFLAIELPAGGQATRMVPKVSNLAVRWGPGLGAEGRTRVSGCAARRVGLGRGPKPTGRRARLRAVGPAIATGMPLPHTNPPAALLAAARCAFRSSRWFRSCRALARPWCRCARRPSCGSTWTLGSPWAVDTRRAPSRCVCVCVCVGGGGGARNAGVGGCCGLAGSSMDTDPAQHI